jgi:hypothetical protein
MSFNLPEDREDVEYHMTGVVVKDYPFKVVGQLVAQNDVYIDLKYDEADPTNADFDTKEDALETIKDDYYWFINKHYNVKREQIHIKLV